MLTDERIDLPLETRAFQMSFDIHPQLSQHADEVDRSTNWSASSWDALRRGDVLRWSIPSKWGGLGYSPVELLIGYESLATSCLTSAFILSQREAAVRLVLKGPESLQKKYLPRSAQSGDLLTVGLSQLTTSRQHGGPALIATPVDDGYRLDGVIPWVTAADQATAIIVGATLADATQILVALTPTSDGVTIEPPMSLASLAGSRTTQVRCDGVRIQPADILAGPIPQVLGPVGGLETSCLALGLACAALELMRPEADRRPEVSETLNALEPESIRLRARLHEAADSKIADASRTLNLRTETTLLALRSTQAALLLAKGVGFVEPHPAQRLARQAHFFLVWSCPRPVADGVRAALLAPS